MGLRSRVTAALRREPAVTALVAVHVAAALVLDFTLGVDIDEGSTLDTTGHGPLHAVQQASRWELQPPLYFVLLSLWRLPFDGPGHARLFSTLCAGAALFVFAAVWRRFTGRERAGWAVAALAFNPSLLWAATEARGYAFLILLVLGVLLTFHDGFLAPAGEAPRRLRLGHAALVAAGLYTQYYSGFLAAGCGAALLLERRFRVMRDHLGWMAVSALLFLPMALQVPRQFAEHAADLSSGTSLGLAARHVEWLATSLVFPTPVPALVDLRALLAWPLAAGALWVAARAGRTLLTGRWRTLATILAVQVLFFVPTMAATGPELMYERHAITLLPTLLLAYTGLFAAEPGRWAQPFAAAVALAFAAQFHIVETARLAKPGDTRRAAAWLSAHARPEEPVLVFHSAAAPALARHLGDAAPLVPLPAPQTYERYRLDDYVLNDAETVRRAVRGHDSLWVYLDEQCAFVGVDFGCPLLERVLAEDFEVVETVPLYRASLRHLRRRGAH